MSPTTRRLIAIIVVVLLVVAAVGLFSRRGGNGAGGDPATAPDAPLSSVVEGLYRAVGEGEYELAWSLYTSDFRANCSFDAFVSLTALLGDGRSLARDVVVEEESGDYARVRFIVDVFSEEGEYVESYDYGLEALREIDGWRLTESCYG